MIADLGMKLKAIEEVWTDNNFQISEKEIQEITDAGLYKKSSQYFLT